MLDKLNSYRYLHLGVIIVTGIIIFGFYPLNKSAFYFWSVIWLLAVAITAVSEYAISKNTKKFFKSIRDSLGVTLDKTESQLNVPIVVGRKTGEVIWCNNLFSKLFDDGKDPIDRNLFEVFDTIDFSREVFDEGVNITMNDHQYTAYVAVSGTENEPLYQVVLIDDNNFKVFAREYFDSRPYVLLMVIDNYTELFAAAKENERSKIMGCVEHIVESFAEENHALLRKLDKDRYVAVVEERYMRNIINGKFKILDEIREIETGGNLSPTMSIGAGCHEGDLHLSETDARQALDMALGRGGDQVALHKKGNYEFYGGVSKGVEKRNKVRPRIVANAIAEVVDECSNIIIMGHRFSDLDCVGSAVGICSGLKTYGKPIGIVVNEQTSLACPLIDKLKEDEEYKKFLMTPMEAYENITDNTLLIIVDVHVRSLLESGDVYDKAKKVIVIDHHRKMVDHISNAILFYHEPNSSSASEMVAELIQYLNDNPKLKVVEAEAMLSGIMLDTKNFTLRTGVRTFEAAAFLRKAGADTIAVRKLFSSTMDNYQQKVRLVSSAELYKNCAIACSDNITGEEARIVAAQAADELLTISNVKASFVVFENFGGASISARSLGELNVQIIMEMLGGGGHQTMAAVQIKDVSLETGKQMLLDAIDKYFEEYPLSEE